ncbi:thioredoxin domain-containing protein [Bacillus sp. ISL-40]|uniref:DsbA family protein n=1 Tax=unclassified Bacillus (in: firmicutes) TaxID=185979 RepID=UPI001BE660D1|nr:MULTISPECIES: thioredoxin domain-containing protein [unclassified Bacillus (in: firmicutes)]MBT2700513.1 thioredoxin domain-containing protein [Bacillus sp. ISL-40]MBT2742781.1 thioredoxin domain-containing protein [Bacillus sp. ISL-77]
MANNNKNKKKESKSSSTFTFWMIGLVAVFILAFIFLGNHSKQQDKTTTTKIDYSNQPFKGKESAPVSIIEFGDYKCPNCKNFAKDVVPIIQQELVDTGKAKFYFMNDSFINVDSTRSAKFAESVLQELGNETFWKFHDLLFEKQPEDTKYEKIDLFTEDFLVDTLKEVASGSDVDKVVKNFQAKKSDNAWNKDMDYAEKLGVTGTPTIFVNGEKFDGQTIDDLKDMVEKASKGE